MLSLLSLVIIQSLLQNKSNPGSDVNGRLRKESKERFMYNSDSPVTAIGWAGTTFHTAGVLAYSAGHSALTLVDTTQHLTTLQYGEEQEDDGADDQAVLALAWSPFGNAIAAAGVEGPKFRIVIKLWTFADDKVGGWVDTSAYYSVSILIFTVIYLTFPFFLLPPPFHQPEAHPARFCHPLQSSLSSLCLHYR